MNVSRRQWRAEKPGMPQPMGLQRVRHDLATKQQQQQYDEKKYMHEWFSESMNEWQSRSMILLPLVMFCKKLPLLSTQNEEFWPAELTGLCTWKSNHYSEVTLFYTTYTCMRFQKLFLPNTLIFMAGFVFLYLPVLLVKYFPGFCTNESCLPYQYVWAPLKVQQILFFSLRTLKGNENAWVWVTQASTFLFSQC